MSCASWSSSLPVPPLGPRGRKRARTPERSIRSGRGHRAGGVTPVEVRHRLRTSKPVTPASRRESWPQGQLVYDCTPIAGAYVTRPRKLARATRAGRSPSECWCTRETRRVREPVATLTRALSMLRFRIGRPLCARFGVWGRWTPPQASRRSPDIGSRRWLFLPAERPVDWGLSDRGASK